MIHSINSLGAINVGGFVRRRWLLVVPLLLLAWGGRGAERGQVYLIKES